MDNKQQGAELNQLSRILFNKAAFLWQLSIVLEFIAGIAGITISLIQASLKANSIVALIIVILLSVAFYIRQKFRTAYDIAETMRRQSVLSEGLDWPISRTQFTEWKSKAGRKILTNFAAITRSNKYYESKENFGPKRLAEMVCESSFWTRNLYKKLRIYLWLILGIFLIAILLVLFITPLMNIDSVTQNYLIYTIYLLLPILLSLDFLDLALLINRSIQSLYEIEKDLELIYKQGNPKIEEVMRLVSEYNCTVASGIPIPNWFFNTFHDEIQAYWDKV